MKIGFDAKRAFCTQAGLGQYSRQHLRMLATQFPEWELHLFSPELRIREFAEELNGFPNVHIHLKSEGASWYWRRYGMVKTVKQLGLSVFHGLSNELPWNLSIPSVLTLHDIIPFQDPSFQPLIQNLTYRWKMRHGIRSATKIICVSKATRSEAENHFPFAAAKMEHIPPAFDYPAVLQGPAKRSRDGSPYILSVGTLEARKNIGTLLEAFTALLDKIPHRLILLGKFTPFAASLQEFARNAGIAHRVDFIGAVEEDEKWAWFRGADVLVYPSLLEGFGLPALEALVFQKPLIISADTAVSEAAGGLGYSVPGRDPEAWAKQIEACCTQLQPPATEQISAHLEQFSPPLLAVKWKNVYQITAGLS